jgi:acyl-CoA thioesterase FadM
MDINKLAHLDEYVIRPESKATVRFHDCDPFRHLNQSRYLDYFVNAREDQLRAHYGLDIFRFAMENGHGWMVTKNQIAYLRQVFVNEIVTIQTHILDFDTSNISVEMLMWDEAKLKPKALLWATFAYVNIVEGKRDIHSGELMEFYGKLKWPDQKKQSFDERVNEVYTTGK